jgi:hypothetical protein
LYVASSGASPLRIGRGVDLGQGRGEGLDGFVGLDHVAGAPRSAKVYRGLACGRVRAQLREVEPRLLARGRRHEHEVLAGVHEHVDRVIGAVGRLDPRRLALVFILHVAHVLGDHSRRDAADALPTLDRPRVVAELFRQNGLAHRQIPHADEGLIEVEGGVDDDVQQREERVVLDVLDSLAAAVLWRAQVGVEAAQVGHAPDHFTRQRVP